MQATAAKRGKTSVSCRPFALTGHMVQNPPYWLTKACSRFEHKGIPTCEACLSLVLDVPVEDATLFCHPVWIFIM